MSESSRAPYYKIELDSVGRGWAGEFAFLSSSQAMLIWLLWGSTLRTTGHTSQNSEKFSMMEALLSEMFRLGIEALNSYLIKNTCLATVGH